MSLNYSFIDESSININNQTNNQTNNQKRVKKTETLAAKVKRKLKRKTEPMVAQYEVFEDSDNEMLGQFDSDEADHQVSKLDPGSGPIHAKNTNTKQNHQNQNQSQNQSQNQTSEFVKHYDTMNFNAIAQANDAAMSNNTGPMLLSSPQTNTMATMTGGNQELLTKLNYLIHLLEDQKDEKAGSITEELVLYCFLGVFIIFVLDSFVKVGKYVR